MIIKENLIYKYDNIITDLECDNIFNYYKNNHNNDINDTNILPWFEGNTLYWNFLKNTSISKEIEISREMITECVLKSYKEIIYPNTTTLVMWKEGKQMNIHKDNGYENEEHILGMREFTSVMYLNDNFEGGETIILKENSNEIEYKCKPQKGSVLIFKSDESCLHGVNKIEKGERLVLSMWFTKNVKYLEN
jgi:hypothetical protein